MGNIDNRMGAHWKKRMGPSLGKDEAGWLKMYSSIYNSTQFKMCELVNCLLGNCPFNIC